MLRVLEGFSDVSGWTATTANSVVCTETGTAMRMTSRGNGLFFSMLGLPGRYEKGTLGFSLAFGSGTNVVNAVFMDGGQERFRVSLTGSGAAGIVFGGKQLANTSGGSFAGKLRNYIELALRPDRTLAVAVAGKTVLVGNKIYAAFDRIAFSLPDDQRSWTDIGDLYFDDCGDVSGDRSAIVMPPSGLSYVPATVFGVKRNGVAEGDNNGVPWTYRDVTKMVGSTVMVSCKRAFVSQHSHSVMAQ